MLVIKLSATKTKNLQYEVNHVRKYEQDVQESPAL